MAARQTHNWPTGKEQKNEKAEKVEGVCQDKSCKTSITNAAKQINFLNTARSYDSVTVEVDCLYLTKVSLCATVTVS